MIEVKRLQKIMPTSYRVGDQIEINLNASGFKLICLCINKPQHKDHVLRLFNFIIL